MRFYTVATVAVALRVPPKWLDNILSTHDVPGVKKARQGIARRLPEEAVVVLEIALKLSRALSVPARTAIPIARELIKSGGSEAEYHLGEGGELRFDVTAIELDLANRLAEAVEIAPTPRRGRPSTRNRKPSI